MRPKARSGHVRSTGAFGNIGLSHAHRVLLFTFVVSVNARLAQAHKLSSGEQMHEQRLEGQIFPYPVISAATSLVVAVSTSPVAARVAIDRCLASEVFEPHASSTRTGT